MNQNYRKEVVKLIDKEKIIEEYRKQLAHERYLKNKKNIDKWRKANREKYNNYMKEYNANYLINKAKQKYKEQYENV